MSVKLVKYTQMAASNTCEGGGSPIIFDLEGDGFSFSDINVNPVLFDLDVDGTQELTSWTLGDDDAFLVFDRNENGVVDNGSELFGNHTLMLSGNNAIHGYHALKELDMTTWGGNEDTILTKDDDQFKKLRLWIDSNRNGISEPNEVRTLNSQGVEVIDLYFFAGQGLDSFGNDLRYQSSVLLKREGQNVVIDTVDVFFEFND